MQGIARISGGILSFVAIMLLTYLFDEGTIGEYNLVLSTIQIITSIATLWLSQSILRFYQDIKDLGSILIMTVFSAVISLAGYFGYIAVTDVSINIWAILFVVITVLYNVFDAVFRKKRELKEYVALEVLLAVGRLFPMVIIAKITKDYNSVFLSQAVVMAAFFLVLVIRRKDAMASTSFSFNREQFSQFLRYGLPLVGLSISNWFLTTSDRYVIKFWGDNIEVGIYSQNYSLGNSIYMMFALILVNAMHPIIMNLWEKDKDKAIQTVSNTMDLYLMFMVPMVFYGCLKSGVLLSIFKGSSYSAHNDIFVWTVLGIFIYGISLLCHKYYECIKKTNQILVINIIAALFNLVSNFLLIPICGFQVAALTTFLSYLLYIVIVRVRTWKEFKIRINIKNTILILGSVVIFWLIDFFFVKSNNLLSFFIEGVIYVLYTVAFYQIFKVYDVKSALLKVVKRR